jgi:predicted alpha/beta-hydrolase family hydrolase
MVWFLFAHGAGAGSAAPWMKKWAELLAEIGSVETFDYPYLRLGRRRPDAQPALLHAHGAALAAGRRAHGNRVVLVGKSMGGRIGCHLALREEVLGVVCLGYPLVSPSGKGPLRSQVLLDLRAAACFVQGSRDPLCPLTELKLVIDERPAPSVLHVVPGGDHSLLVRKRQLEAENLSQEKLDRECLETIARFCAGL